MSELGRLTGIKGSDSREKEELKNAQEAEQL
jgi:hypothetical protein